MTQNTERFVCIVGMLVIIFALWAMATNNGLRDRVPGGSFDFRHLRQ